MSIRSGRPTPTACIPPDSALRAPTLANIRRGADDPRAPHLACRHPRDYRRAFWRFAWAGCGVAIDGLIMVSLVAHHLILFCREASSGRRDASHYTFKPRERLVAAE